MILDVAAIALIFVGLTLATIGLYGLLRMPAIFDQLHAAGLVTGPATLPLSGHAIAQAAYRTRQQDEPDDD
jgi:multisubunit Na+/H+ antiporter MnhG subunit